MSESATKQLTVLFLRGASDDAPAIVQRLGDQVHVLYADSLEEALAMARASSVDIVVAEPAWFSTIEYAITPHADSVFEHVAQGVGIVNRDGTMTWNNPRMLAFPENVRARIAELCREAFDWASEGDFHRPSHQHGRRFTLDIQRHTYEVNITPILDADRQFIQVAAVAWDATRARTLQEKINAIDRAAAELVSLDVDQIDRLDMQQRLDLLEQKIIRYTRELMHFDNFTVHILDKKTNKLELVLFSGMPSEVQEIPIYALPEGNGVCGYVAAQGRSYICPDVAQDDRYIPGIEGGRSCLAVPLRLHDEVIGVFNVESTNPAAFTEDDRQFAEIFARHIAMALHILNLLVSERHRTTGQMASDVGAEITGPLNDLLTEVQGMVEDYIGHDELRHRLHKLSDCCVQIRDAIRQVTTERRGLIDRQRSSKSVRHDPVLKGRRILVVDDEEVIRETVSDVLRSYGCEIEEASDGAAGIALLQTTNYDLVLSDIRMPGHNGYEIFAAAKERNPDCPVILMTGFGYDPNHSIVRARREGLAAVLFKPFKVEQLLGEIRTAIRSAQKG